MQRRVIETVAERRQGGRVPAVRAEVGGDIGRVGVDRHWRAERDLLPATGRLIAEGGRSESLAIVVPQHAGVRAQGARGLVEANAVDEAVGVGAEARANHDRLRVERALCRWRVGAAEQGARASRGVDGDVDAGARNLQVGAVIGGP